MSTEKILGPFLLEQFTDFSDWLMAYGIYSLKNYTCLGVAERVSGNYRKAELFCSHGLKYIITNEFITTKFLFQY